MSVAILSNNPVFEKVLRDILSLAKISIACLEEKENSPKVAIIDGASFDNVGFLQNLNCPLLFVGADPEACETAEQLERPFRLGCLIDRIEYYFKIHALRQSKADINIGDMVLDLQGSALKKEGHESIALTEKEGMILAFLHEAGNNAVGRQTLLDKVWGYASTVETHTLETHIYRLRQKIEIDPAKPDLLVTEENGYRLNF